MPPAEFHRYGRKVQIAARDADTKATDAQREAGNFRVGRVFIHGLELALEYPKGSVRRGVSPDGKAWQKPMTALYGRVCRTRSPHDQDAVDFYMGDKPDSQLVFVISQLDDNGNLDEHKCVMGCSHVAEAKKLYLAHYPKGWEDEHLGEIRGMFMRDFKQWLTTDNPVKSHPKKSAGLGFFCRGCNTFWKNVAKEDGCPECDPKE